MTKLTTGDINIEQPLSVQPVIFRAVQASKKVVRFAVHGSGQKCSSQFSNFHLWF